MRLLSEDAVIHNLATYFMEGKKSIGQCLDETPTAYDLDKVLEQLSNMIEVNVDFVARCDNFGIDMRNEIIRDCIEVVKRGGK